MADPSVDTDRPSEPERSSVVTVPVLAGAYASGFVLSTIAFVLFSVTADSPAGDPVGLEDMPFAALLPIQAALWGGMLVVPYLIARAAGQRLFDRGSFSVEPRRGALAVLAGLGLQLVVIPVVYLPILRLLDDADLSAEARRLTDRADGAVNVLVLVVIVVFGAPIVEEIFFRGLLQPRFVARFGPVIGIGLTALLFAASHIQLLQFPALLVMGSAVGWLAHRWGGVVPAILAHLGFNLVTVYVLLVLD